MDSSPQIATLMGFLEAGVILREGGVVLGLTTAATLWTVTAIGLFIGSQHYALGLLLTATTVGILIALWFVERLLAGIR